MQVLALLCPLQWSPRLPSVLGRLEPEPLPQQVLLSQEEEEASLVSEAPLGSLDWEQWLVPCRQVILQERVLRFPPQGLEDGLLRCRLRQIRGS